MSCFSHRWLPMTHSPMFCKFLLYWSKCRQSLRQRPHRTHVFPWQHLLPESHRLRHKKRNCNMDAQAIKRVEGVIGFVISQRTFSGQAQLVLLICGVRKRENVLSRDWNHLGDFEVHLKRTYDISWKMWGYSSTFRILIPLLLDTDSATWLDVEVHQSLT